jgi:cbb3-type cytochrome c oxidase subunit III
LTIVKACTGMSGNHQGMKLHPLTGSALALLISAFSCASSAQAPAVAAAPQASASSAALVLPQWAQDKLAALRTDPKAFDQAYRQGAKVAAFCENCHGPSGHSVKPEVPNLAGQNTIYVLNQLSKFHEGKRTGAFFMEGLVKAMSKDELFAVAVYYTTQQAKVTPPADPALAAKGQSLYDLNCKFCHGDSGHGNEMIARIAGQQALYMSGAIHRYRENKVRSDIRMYTATQKLSESDIQALVAYVGSMQ